MKITILQFDPTIVKGPAERGGDRLVRSPGLHLSQIYSDLDEVQRKREQSGTGMSEQELQYYRMGGWIWETIWSQAMAECIRNGEIIRPGELMLDGIIGSPDNVRISMDGLTVIETKCTWKSVRKWDNTPLEKWFWVWGVQMKGYCRMLGTPVAELYVMFVNGDYKGSGPLTRAARYEYSELELAEGWDMIVGHAKRKGWIK